MEVDLQRSSFLDVTGCIRCGRCTKLCHARYFESTIFNRKPNRYVEENLNLIDGGISDGKNHVSKS